MFQKELIIGCLISYVALDVMLGLMVHKNNPEIIAELKESFMGKESTFGSNGRNICCDRLSYVKLFWI